MNNRSRLIGFGLIAAACLLAVVVPATLPIITVILTAYGGWSILVMHNRNPVTFSALAAGIVLAIFGVVWSSTVMTDEIALIVLPALT